MNRVLDSLRKFQLAQAAAMRRAADALGVSDTALNTLNTLNTLVAAQAEAGLSMKELAHEVGVSPAVLTGLVDKLEEQGWVERHLSPTDRRSTVVTPTIAPGSPVDVVLQALDEPLRRVANSVPDDIAAVVRLLASAMEDELRSFNPQSAMGEPVA